MKDLDGLLRKMVLQLTEDLNTPRSLTVAILVRHREWVQLLSLRIAAEHYTDPELFAKDNLITELLRKLDSDLGADKGQLEQEAWERLRATERLCFQTNKRMMKFLTGPLDQSDFRFLEFFEKVRKTIRYIVGPIPETLTSCGFGPGATLTNTSRLSTIPDKIESSPVGTARALEIFDALFRECAWDRSQRPGHRSRVTVRGNRFFTVPKTALSLRGAALSPNVNGFLQKGVGNHLRQRLAAKVGIHIGSACNHPLFSVNDWSSADKHREMARSGSLTGALATIDLSDASNTIARKLIELVWPEAWHSLLCDLREPVMQGPDGRTYLLEMFSAMGNGFTFEVETITFYAICVAAGAKTVSVFGDDIIVDTESAADCVAALRFCGFIPNPRKTFISGNFRESCGGDYFAGVNVRGHYVKTDPSAPQHWISIANGLRRFCDSGPSPDLRWAYVRRSWGVAVSAIPRYLRDCRGPSGLGDLVIYDPLWQSRERNSRHWYKAYAPINRRLPLSHWPERVVYASALYGVPSDGVIPRDAVSGYRVKWISYS